MVYSYNRCSNSSCNTYSNIHRELCGRCGRVLSLPYQAGRGSSALAAAGLQQQHQGCCTLHSVVPLPMLNNVVHPCMQDSVVPLPMLDSVVHFCMLDSVVHREHLCCTHRELCGQWGQ